MVSTAAFHARVRGSVPGLDGLKETKMFLPHPRVKRSILGSLCDREVACSTSDRRVWRTVSSHSSHHPQEVLLAQFSLYVHKGGLKPDLFHFYHVKLSRHAMPIIWFNWAYSPDNGPTLTCGLFAFLACRACRQLLGRAMTNCSNCQLEK